MYRESPDINFIEAILGLTLQPGETTEVLFEDERPRYAYGCLLCLLVTVFTPIVAQHLKYGINLGNSEAMISLGIVVGMTVLVFLLAECLFLLVLGVRATIAQVFASLCYTFTPFTVGLLLIYLFNYFAHGSITVVDLLVTGSSNSNDRFLIILPYALMIIQLNCLLVFWYSLRAFGQIGAFSAAAIAFLSLIPFYASLIGGLFVGEMARPGTIEIFKRILLAPDLAAALQLQLAP